MKILQRYVAQSYLTAFVLTLLVLSFVLSVGLLVKATEMVVKGLALRLVLNFIAVGVPESFTFTVPLSLLVSALLVFGRMSADGEISAMKACGVSLRSIMLWPILFGLLMTALCAYVNNEISPRSHYVRRSLLSSIGLGAGLKLLEPGRFIEDFPGLSFWFARREGNLLHDVLIFDKTRAGHKREVRAETARVEVVGKDLHLDMHKVRIDPFADDQPGAATADRLVHVIPGALDRKQYTERMDDYRLRRMLDEIRAARTNAPPQDVSENERETVMAQRARDLRKMVFELNRRFSLAAAAISFVLLGIPLGVRAQRRESTIGVAISIGVMLLYYVLVIGADSLVHRPGMHPNLLAWLPSVLCLSLAVWLVARNQ